MLVMQYLHLWCGHSLFIRLCVRMGAVYGAIEKRRSGAVRRQESCIRVGLHHVNNRVRICVCACVSACVCVCMRDHVTSCDKPCVNMSHHCATRTWLQRIGVGHRSIPQLAIAVVTRGPHSAIFLQDQAVSTACCDCCGACAHVYYVYADMPVYLHLHMLGRLCVRPMEKAR